MSDFLRLSYNTILLYRDRDHISIILIIHTVEASAMKEFSRLYKLLSASLGVSIFFLSGSYKEDAGTSNFVNVPIRKLDVIDLFCCNQTFGTTTTKVAKYNTTHNEEYHDVEYFQDLLHDMNCAVAFVVVILAFACLFYYSIGRGRPPDSVELKKSKNVWIFIHQHKHPYYVNIYDTISDLKQKIGDRIGGDVIFYQFLTFGGKQLSDDKKMIDYNIQKHSTLFLSGRILGGATKGEIRGGARRGKRNKVKSKYDRADSTDISEVDILFYGLLYVGYDKLRQLDVDHDVNITRFRCFYGVGHLAVAAVIRDLNDSDLDLKNFLLALNYLKTYNTETVLSGWWGLNEDTVRKWAKHYQKEIQKLKKKKVSSMILFNLSHIFYSIILLTLNLLQIVCGDLKYDTKHILTVDGVHFRTYESRKVPTAKVYSHKFNGPGLTYEIAVAIYESRVLSITGPYPASKADITIFRENLINKIPDGKKGIGDSGYEGEPEKLTIHRDSHSKNLTNFINRVRARHENFNARIKNFCILSDRFRSNKKVEHKLAFEAICILVQYDMENGHPLMEVS